MLLQNDNVGMNGPLVDAEGFPRNDIDVYQVRQARQQIICMQNDHKELMKQIEEWLHKLHAEAKTEAMQLNNSSEDEQSSSSEAATATQQNGALPSAPVVPLQVIVKVNLVSPDSPAETAGLRIDDEILQFGTINSTNFTNNLQEIGQLVQHMQNQRIALKVRRAQQQLDMILIPKPWSGRGLLGCNIVLP